MKNKRSIIADPGVFRKILFFLFSLFLLCEPQVEARQQDITATGIWANPISAANLISGAGSELRDTYQSATNATIIQISNSANKNDAWQVYVRRSDISWSGFTIYVKRTGNGSGTGGTAVSGGLSFQAVTTSNTLFFSGHGNRNNIPIQYQLSGVSLQTSPSIYLSSVVFTVVDVLP